MTRNAAAPLPAPALSDSAGDDWDMPPRREGQVMAEAARPNRKIETADPDRPLPTGRGLLSPAEIEALLRPDLSDLPPDAPAMTPVSARPVSEFTGNMSASTVQPDQDLARRLAARLSMALRESCGAALAVTAAETGRGAFDAAVKTSGDERGQAIACFTAVDGDIAAMLIMSPGLAQWLIETACGARTRGGAVKPLSQIDLAVLEAVLGPLARALSPKSAFSSLETETVFAASIAPPSEALSVSLTVRAQSETFRAHLVLGRTMGTDATPEAAHGAQAPGLQAALSATLTARIASLAVPLSRLSGLKPGATLLLGVPADQPVELVSGPDGVVVAQAEVGRRGAKVALRITRRGAALGPLTRAAT